MLHFCVIIVAVLGQSTGLADVEGERRIGRLRASTGQAVPHPAPTPRRNTRETVQPFDRFKVGASVEFASISSDAKLLATKLEGLNAFTLRVWDLAEQRVAAKSHHTLGRYLNQVEFIPGTSHLVGAAKNGELVVWDAAAADNSAERPQRLVKLREVELLSDETPGLDSSGLYSVAASSKGDAIAVGGYSKSGFVALLERPNYKVRWTAQFDVKQRSPRFVTFSPDASRLYSTGWGIAAWDASTGNVLYRRHSDTAFGQIDVSSDGSLLAIGSSQGASTSGRTDDLQGQQRGYCFRGSQTRGANKNGPLCQPVRRPDGRQAA